MCFHSLWIEVDRRSKLGIFFFLLLNNGEKNKVNFFRELFKKVNPS